ncbi:hypothetical protein N864_06420 [Intrasporangium chromatireducens Q5-1]|uniref:Methyltransferase domain-containing protein n=1 Tax=Intrasporangium chromatireducens Q5-1 TaxID=584657 RepID=W9GUN1_9MICO|nr:methyltransferase domain-containing protein [Intrasporangium chromatireducens]EWT07569.1 hypothetical protein N864_06420 [Intrasporangium chromatireducens Q5-1]
MSDQHPHEALPALLAQDEVVSYWDRRHESLDEFLSGGDVSFGYHANEAFYATRLGRLLDILQPTSVPLAPDRVLDAGCGKGWFTRALARCGYRVDGIDSSPHAIAEAAREAVGLDTYEVATLHEWAPPHLYDAVVAIDVLFHVTQDDVWLASVHNLAALTRLDGLLVIADHDHPGAHVWGQYQITRGSGLYREQLEPLGFEYRGFSPYRFRGNKGGFHTFERTS